MPPRDRTSLGILAGGRGRRLGGVDKAFVTVQGMSLLERVLAAAGEGFPQILVSHNRPAAEGRARLEARGLRFIGDGLAAGEGPLAGLDALLHATATDWLLTLPVDLGRPTRALVDALLHTDGAVVGDADGLQPLVALWPVADARAQVRATIAEGGRAIHPLAATLGLQVLHIAPARLGNLNTPRDFEDFA